MSNGLAIMLWWAAAAAIGQTGPQSSCAEEVQASATAYRLSELPHDIREDLPRLEKLLGDRIADSDVPLLQTDAPSEREKTHATARFAQAMLVGDHWFIQVEASLMTGVLTISYWRQPDEAFRLTNRHVFRGPACASIKAALSGVTTPGGFGPRAAERMRD